MAKKENKSLLEKLLGLFAEVKAGEGLLAIIMTLNIFLVLNAYYVLKPIRDSLITNAVLFGITGDELAAYLQAVMAFLLLFVVRGYGQLASRVNRIKLLNLTTSFVVACVLLFYVLLRILKIDGAGIAIAYFVWLGIINVFIIAQFWSYANDIYTEKQGKRLFAIIAIGQATGAIFGSWLSKTYGVKYTFVLLFSAAVVLAFCQILYNVINKRVADHGTGAVEEEETATNQVEEPLSKDGGFQLVLRSKYLLYIALMILVANLVNTTGEFLIKNTFRAESAKYYPDDMYTEGWVARVEAGEQELPDKFAKSNVVVIANENAREEELKTLRKGFGTSFFGSFYFWVNLCVAIIQMFLVSRIFKFLGVRMALFALPLIAVAGNLFFGFVGTLLALRISKTAENSTDYSLQNTVKQALFLPTTREEKYKAKAATDTFFVRLGDALSAGLVALGTYVLLFSREQFAFANVALGVVWIFICIKLFREHKRLVPDDGKPTE